MSYPRDTKVLQFPLLQHEYQDLLQRARQNGTSIARECSQIVRTELERSKQRSNDGQTVAREK